MTGAFAWTEERVAHLRKRWDDGASCSTIAAELVTSRNSVIGKIHGLGLSGRVKQPPRGRTRAVASAVAAPSERRDRLLAAASARDRWPVPVSPAATQSCEPKPQPARVDPIAPGTIELLDLASQHCRWPSGDGAAVRFCGQPRVEREFNGMACPYCEGHARMAYAPTSPPKDRTSRQAAADGRLRQSLSGRWAA